jgi:hypothetical protein
MSDELKERNILKLILIVRFACATLDVGHLLSSSQIYFLSCFRIRIYVLYSPTAEFALAHPIMTHYQMVSRLDKAVVE